MPAGATVTYGPGKLESIWNFQRIRLPSWPMAVPGRRKVTLIGVVLLEPRAVTTVTVTEAVEVASGT